MANGILTLKERHALKMERVARAIDAALTAYARRHGGRFVRFGSTAEGRTRDIIADLAGESSLVAADFAERLCRDNGMSPDTHAGAYLSPAFKAAAERRGRVLA